MLAPCGRRVLELNCSECLSCSGLKSSVKNLQAFPWPFPLLALTLLFECGTVEKFNSTDIYESRTMFRARGQA